MKPTPDHCSDDTINTLWEGTTSPETIFHDGNKTYVIDLRRSTLEIARRRLVLQ